MIILAGDESRAGNPLLADFILLSRKLEKLGFIYDRDNVIINATDYIGVSGKSYDRSTRFELVSVCLIFRRLEL